VISVSDCDDVSGMSGKGIGARELIMLLHLKDFKVYFVTSSTKSLLGLKLGKLKSIGVAVIGELLLKASVNSWVCFTSMLFASKSSFYLSQSIIYEFSIHITTYFLKVNLHLLGI